MTEGWRRQYYIEKPKLHCKIDDFAAKAFREYKVREYKDQRVQRTESAKNRECKWRKEPGRDIK